MIRTASRSSLLLHEEGRNAILQFLQTQRNPDGGFRGRTPASDLYYTVFGLSCLLALNNPLPISDADRFLAATDCDTLDFVHLAAAARCLSLMALSAAPRLAMPFLRRMEIYRAQDGGYHHQSVKASTGTVYGSFLACLAYQEVGVNMPYPERLLPALVPLRTPDGGFANAAGIAQSTATATSAAILLQQWLSDKINDDAAIAALQRGAAPSGGYFAFAGAPNPDLLSTATCLYALRSSGHPPAANSLHENFIESLWHENGGFCGQADDYHPDVEYTFYALLALGCGS
jgi:hypothetical protein